MTTSSTPSRDTSTRSADRAADATWRRLSAGFSATWLDEIRVLRAEGDDFERSLDIWSIALIAALKNPARKETASTMIARLRKLGEKAEDIGA